MGARQTTLFGAILSLLFYAGALAAEPCVRTAGDDGLVIEAIVLTPAGILPKGQVWIGADGRIGCVGDDCRANWPNAAVISCPQAVLSPGFVNGHEHLDFNHIAPTSDDGVRYGHRHDWRKGLRGLPSKETFALDRNPDLLAWSELRHLLSGTTSMIGEAYAPGLVRNLDFQEGLEGLSIPRATYAIFPLDDAPGILRDGDCDYGPRAADERTVSALHAFVAHVAEGRDAPARNEFSCLSSRTFDTQKVGDGGVSHDIIGHNVAMIHGVALTEPMLRTAADRGAGLIWSPRSNLYLYGQTADIAAARRAGVTLALGTDWLPSGSATMPREAACALAYSRVHLNGLLTPQDLWRMMTLDAAKVVQAGAVLGAIESDLFADLILVEPQFADPYESVVRTRPQDVLLILRGGKALAGAPALLPRTSGCETADLNGAARTLCLDYGKSYGALAGQMAERKLWPAVFADAPPIEPPCVRRP